MIDLEIYGEGEPFVLLPGAPVPPASLDPIRRRFESSRRVVVPHLEGVGARPEDVLEPLRTSLVSAGIERAPVLGHSLGAYRALQLALSEDFDVERLVGVGVMAYLPDPVQREYEQLADGFEAGAIDLPGVLADQWFGDRYHEETTDPSEVVREWIDEIGDEAVLSAGRVEVAGRDLRAELEEIDIPVYLQTGAEDAATPAEWAREVAERIPGAELDVIDGAGHFPFLERPDAALPPIESFLDEPSD